jgi:hypothetical protein
VKRILCLVLAACGDNAAIPIDAPPAYPLDCTALLTGNFAETTSSPNACPVMLPADAPGHTNLDFLIPSTVLGTLAVRIDVGAVPAVAVYVPENTATWEAIAVRSVPVRGACTFAAGSADFPEGYFHLRIDELTEVVHATTAHGSLVVTMFVLPRTGEDGIPTDCGPGPTETLMLAF